MTIGWKTKRASVATVAMVVVTATTLIAAPIASAQGKYGNLTAQWWQWVNAQPAVDLDGTNTNPVLDSTGEYATAGQEDGIGPGNKFFFLAGTFGGTSRARSRSRRARPCSFRSSTSRSTTPSTRPRASPCPS